ncbi:hypothetical protein [Psychrobacter frigidicola]|uniref:hypothetical protein n=1 Tax=Psychrobacter frigidicola TaxID=45611 RepID=UPI001D0F66F2|nr:hypothetical protein [Psychrobacter frigidicola]
MLPDVGGFELIHNYRAACKKHTSVLFLTARDGLSERLALIALPIIALDGKFKPFQPF